MVRAISKEKKDGGRIIKRRMDEREKEKRKEREERREGGQEVKSVKKVHYGTRVH